MFSKRTNVRYSSILLHGYMRHTSQKTHSNHLSKTVFKVQILIFSLLIIESYQWPLRQLRVGSSFNTSIYFLK